jgi:hypothetical protein
MPHKVRYIRTTTMDNNNNSNCSPLLSNQQSQAVTEAGLSRSRQASSNSSSRT